MTPSKDTLLLTRNNPLLENIPVSKMDIQKTFNLAIQIFTFENFLKENLLTIEKINLDPFLKENTIINYKKYFSSKLLDSSWKMLRHYLETVEKNPCTPGEIEEFNKAIHTLYHFEAILLEDYLAHRGLLGPEKTTTSTSSHTTENTKRKVMKNLNSPTTHKKK